MGTAVPIGVFTRVAGVWERVNGGTPIGFSGPQLRQAGVWENADNVQAYTTLWLICWTNIDGEINVGSYSATDFDISPYSIDVYVDMNLNGSVDRKNHNTVYNNYATWRYYDNGRDYQYKVERDTPFGNDAYLYAEPTLDTWLDFPAAITFGASKSGTGYLFWDAWWIVRIREKVSAPAGGNDFGSIHLNMDAEV